MTPVFAIDYILRFFPNLAPKRNVYVDRLEGYKQALSESDIPFREDLLMITTLTQSMTPE